MKNKGRKSRKSEGKMVRSSNLTLKFANAGKKERVSELLDTANTGAIRRQVMKY